MEGSQEDNVPYLAMPQSAPLRPTATVDETDSMDVDQLPSQHLISQQPSGGQAHARNGPSPTNASAPSATTAGCWDGSGGPHRSSAGPSGPSPLSAPRDLYARTTVAVYAALADGRRPLAANIIRSGPLTQTSSSSSELPVTPLSAHELALTGCLGSLGQSGSAASPCVDGGTEQPGLSGAAARTAQEALQGAGGEVPEREHMREQVPEQLQEELDGTAVVDMEVVSDVEMRATDPGSGAGFVQQPPADQGSAGGSGAGCAARAHGTAATAAAPPLQQGPVGAPADAAVDAGGTAGDGTAYWYDSDDVYDEPDHPYGMFHHNDVYGESDADLDDNTWGDPTPDAYWRQTHPHHHRTQMQPPQPSQGQGSHPHNRQQQQRLQQTWQQRRSPPHPAPQQEWRQGGHTGRAAGTGGSAGDGGGAAGPSTSTAAPAGGPGSSSAGAGAGPGCSSGGGGVGGLCLRPWPGPELVTADPWSEDEEEDTDTTAEQFYSAAHPKDIQGIPWERLQFNRSTYRDTRLRQYRNYTNLLPDDDNGAYRAELAPLCAAPRRGGTAGAGGGAGAGCVRGPPFFAFVRNSRAVQSNIVHFQLRNLVWATSANDVFVVHDNCVNHWNPAARKVTEVLNLTGSAGGGGGAGGGARAAGGGSVRVPGLGRVQVSTLCVSGDLVAAGGFMGELVVKRLSGSSTSSSAPTAAIGPTAAAAAAVGGRSFSSASPLPHLRHPSRAWAGGPGGSPVNGAVGAPAGLGRGGWGLAGSGAEGGGGKAHGGGGAGGMHGSLLYCGRVTSSDNGITNGLEIFADRAHGTVIMSANNDAQLRLFAAAAGEGSLRPLARWPFDWAVNYATVRPDSHVAAVVGDDMATLLTDVHNGTTVARLEGHRDFSFAAAWHPGGVLLATGNQDTTALLWDVRRTDQPLTRLAGRMGAIRSLRFTPDGRFLAMSEPADFVHVYDVASSFQECQEHDFFGEIAGIAFTPDSSSLFVGVSDLTYASLMQLDRQRCEWW